MHLRRGVVQISSWQTRTSANFSIHRGWKAPHGAPSGLTSFRPRDSSCWSYEEFLAQALSNGAIGKMGENRPDPFLLSAHVVQDSPATPARAPLSLTPRWVLR